MIDEERLIELRSWEMVPPPLEAIFVRGERLRKRRVKTRVVAVATLCLAFTAGTVVAAKEVLRGPQLTVELAAPTGALSVPEVAIEGCGGYAEMLRRKRSTGFGTCPAGFPPVDRSSTPGPGRTYSIGRTVLVFPSLCPRRSSRCGAVRSMPPSRSKDRPRFRTAATRDRRSSGC